MPSLSPAQPIRLRARRSLQLLGVALLPAALACAPAQASSTPPVAAASQSEAARSTQRMIDRDLWRPFIEHFAAGQTEAYLALRAPGFIRVSGAERTVIGMDVYARKTREMFDTLRQRGTQASIDLRFVERLAGVEQAFETGIWALRMVRSTGESTMHYGRFQALSVRTGGRWRLLMDHDVPLSAAEGARQFAEASPMSS